MYGKQSASGHKRTFRSASTMSALPPRGDMCGATRDVRYGPKADIRASRIWRAFPLQAARSTRVSISLRSTPKSIGLVKSASAPPSNALRLVSASP